MSRPACLLAFLLAGLAWASHSSDDGYTDPELTPQDKAHWSFQKPVRPAVPTVREAKWGRNPIDAFILAKLEAAGLKPAPEADKLTLIRRVTLDLTGLPPTPAEIDSFLNDNRPDAYERLVERLLASPHFGERMATHWLDVVRFAESNGYELDAERPHAWRYRDYVIQSFNADKPYDRFITEQIAGDELAAGKDQKEAIDLWVATGLQRCGPVHVVSGNLDQDVLRQERLTEMVNGIGSAVLGLTLGCARCHDHKFDPISQGDYFRVQAFFAAAKYTDVDFATAEEKEARKKQVEELEGKMAPLKKQIAAIDAPYKKKIAAEKNRVLEQKYKDALAVPKDKRTAEQKQLAADAEPLIKVHWEEILEALNPTDRVKRLAIREQLHELDAQMPPPTAAAWAIETGKEEQKTFVLKRGDPHRKSGAVVAAFPRVLAAAPGEPKTRLELAKWVTNPDNPLTARVMVNRLWQMHFGRGIVASPNDFGTRGDRPTHPELLDWLASELVSPANAQPWSLKHLHRLMVLSSTYRQAAVASHGVKADPENKLLWRMNLRRLEAEAMRDCALATAGTLNRDLGGPSVKVPLEPEVYDLIFTEAEPDGLWPVTPDAKQHTRRSVYLFNKRNVRLPMFEAFDQPDTLNSCACRPVSTFAPQALILMNGPFVQDQGKALAVRLAKDVGLEPDRQVEALYRAAFGRSPRGDEKQLALAFLAEQVPPIRDRLKARLPIGINASELPAGGDVAQVRALADLCVVVFNTNEFVYIP